MRTFIVSVEILWRNIESNVAHELTSPVVNVQQLDQIKEIVVHHNAHQMERF